MNDPTNPTSFTPDVFKGMAMIKGGRKNCTAPGSDYKPRPKLKVPLGIYSHISLRSGKFKSTMNTGRSIPPSTTTLVLLPGLIPTGILAPQLVMRAATVPPRRVNEDKPILPAHGSPRVPEADAP